MMTRRFATAVLGFALAATIGMAPTAATGQTPTVPKELAGLQGAWLITSVDGQDIGASGVEIFLTVTGDKYTQTTNGEVVERGTLKVDATKKPMTIDLMISEGQDAGATQLGVIEIGETWIHGKLNSPGATTRPSDFEPADGYFTFAAAKK